jgi:hypothetical protein
MAEKGVKTLKKEKLLRLFFYNCGVIFPIFLQLTADSAICDNTVISQR